jgi:hypothetical protein
MKRYAAKLLFAWRPNPFTEKRGSTLYEERIVVFTARSGQAALGKFKRVGKSNQLVFEGGQRVEFVGIQQLMELDVRNEADEVWWEFRRIRSPKKLIPRERDLYVFTDKTPTRHKRR